MPSLNGFIFIKFFSSKVTDRTDQNEKHFKLTKKYWSMKIFSKLWELTQILWLLQIAWPSDCTHWVQFLPLLQIYSHLRMMGKNICIQQCQCWRDHLLGTSDRNVEHLFRIYTAGLILMLWNTNSRTWVPLACFRNKRAHRVWHKETGPGSTSLFIFNHTTESFYVWVFCIIFSIQR